jgi:hypothetical protein
MNKINPINLGLVVNPFCILVEWIEVDVKLEEELEEFEGTFERDEILEI